MTVCSVPVPHNATASNAIQISKQRDDHEHRYFLSNNKKTGLAAGRQREGVDRKSLREWLAHKCTFTQPALALPGLDGEVSFPILDYGYAI